MSSRTCALLILVVALGSCHDDDDAGSEPIIRSLAIGDAIVPPGAAPPFGLTWFIRFNNNVPPATLTAFAPAISAVNASIWNVTEGQVYIRRAILSDNVAPGARASGFIPASAGGVDMVIFVGSTWDLPGILGYLQFFPFVGREGRAIAVPDNVANNTMIHEMSHLIFRLSWGPNAGPLLEDEYLDGIQDPACIMEGVFAPLRWCSAPNHVPQSVQPRACWAQILIDYPAFRYTGTNMAGTPAPAVQIDIADSP